MTQRRHEIGSTFLTLTFILALLIFTAGCELNSDLARKEAKQLLLAQNLYPAEIVRGVVAYKEGFNPNEHKKYQALIEQTGVATSRIEDYIGKNAYGTPLAHARRFNLHLIVLDQGKPFVRGELTKKGINFILYPGGLLPVLIYTVNFGEVTGIAFQNQEKTLALVEYTETYTPSPFTKLYEQTEDGKPRYSTEKRTATLKLYDDGWRILEDAASRELTEKEKRTAPPESFSMEKVTELQKELERAPMDRASFMVGLFRDVCLSSEENIRAKFESLANDPNYSTEPAPYHHARMMKVTHSGADFGVTYYPYPPDNQSCMVSAIPRANDGGMKFDPALLETAMNSLNLSSNGDTQETQSDDGLTAASYKYFVAKDGTTIDLKITHDIKSDSNYFVEIHKRELGVTAAARKAKKTQQLNVGKRVVVRDLLTAYGNDRSLLASVAMNADYALLAWAAYEDNAALDLAKERGWKKIKSYKDNHLIAGDSYATLFESSNTPDLVLAFRGTKTLGDWVTNINGTFSANDLSNVQIEGARKIAREVEGEYKDAFVIAVGHSLGGRMAQVAAYELSGKSAAVFNTAPLGVNDRSIILKNGTEQPVYISSFRSPEDPLSAIFSPNDTEVSNIVTVEGGTLADAVSADYTHSIEVIAQAMHQVWIADDSGWIASYLNVSEGKVP